MQKKIKIAIGRLWSRVYRVLILACLVASLPTSIYATGTIQYSAMVVDVVDGNTIIVSNRVSGPITMLGQHTIILDSIAAPDLSQQGGQDAKVFLETKIKDRIITVVELTDRGKSRGAWVFVGEAEKSVNVSMIEEGKAWLADAKAVSEPKSRRELSKIKDAFLKAKDQKTGIWADDNPVPPWEWRKDHPKKE